MSTRKSGRATKEKILESAKAEILEKGIDGCTMESIARRAGITRMMLYYHFESKDKIIIEFMLNLFNTAKPLIQEGIGIILESRNASPEKFLGTIESVMKPNLAIIRIFLSEVMKNQSGAGEVGDAILAFLGELFSGIIESIGKFGKKIKDREAFFTKVFFFQSAPLVFFLVFSKDLIGHFGFDEAKVKTLFGKKFFETLRSTIMSMK